MLTLTKLNEYEATRACGPYYLIKHNFRRCAQDNLFSSVFPKNVFSFETHNP